MAGGGAASAGGAAASGAGANSGAGVNSGAGANGTAGAAGAPGSQAAGSSANTAGAPATGSAVAGSGSTAAAGTGTAAAGSAGSAPNPAALAAELQPSERAQHRASWLQDHLLGVMTGLLALIVLIIAWLLRRANAARDEADATPRVTESMVRERIQDIDLDLEPGESRPPRS